MLLKLPPLQLWHMLPIALGLHGLLFAVPIPSVDNQEAEKPKSESEVNVVNLPKPSPSEIASPTSKPSPKIQPSPKVQPSLAASPTPQQPVQPQQQISPSPQPSISPSVSPSPMTSPPPTTSPSPTDVLQIIGATPGCGGKAGCWKLSDSNGRVVAGTIEQHLEKQGLTYKALDLEQDTGFRVYEVAKDGVKQYYLHMIWSDRGTAYVRNENLLSYDQLVAAVQL